MDALISLDCSMPDKNTKPMGADMAAPYMDQIKDWVLIRHNGVDTLHRDFDFPDFLEALAFTNRVGALAEEQNHHPTLITTWGKVSVYWTTHRVKGLHMNDLISAAKTDAVR